LSSPGSCNIDIHTSPFLSIFGCHISVINFIRGGLSGYSFGNCKCALKKPPSYNVSGGPIMSTSHRYMSLSSMRPAENPSTGFLFNSVRKEEND